MTRRVVVGGGKLENQLHQEIDGKFPPKLAGNMKGITDRMRDCSFEKLMLDVGTFYLPSAATADDLEGIETDFAHMGVAFIYQKLEQGNPPKTPDTDDSMNAKIEAVKSMETLLFQEEE